MTLKSDRAGDQLCLRISMHILPLSLIFIWYMLYKKSEQCGFICTKGVKHAPSLESHSRRREPEQDR